MSLKIDMSLLTYKLSMLNISQTEILYMLSQIRENNSKADAEKCKRYQDKYPVNWSIKQLKRTPLSVLIEYNEDEDIKDEDIKDIEDEDIKDKDIDGILIRTPPFLDIQGHNLEEFLSI